MKTVQKKDSCMKNEQLALLVYINSSDRSIKSELTSYLYKHAIGVYDNIDSCQIAVFYRPTFTSTDIEMLRRLRLKNVMIPILCVSYEQSEKSRLALYDAGIDMHMGMTCGYEIIVCKIRVCEKWLVTGKHNQTTFNFKNCMLKGLVLTFPDGTTLTLTKSESKVLEVFFTAHNRIVYRKEMMQIIYGDSDDYFHSRSLDTQICRIRRYLKGTGIHIKTINNKGWGMVDKKPYNIT